ncbi:MAG TPA: methyltransferase domain-containing protein [Thermoanaerobaculia bacterium]|nr:methyltransferase domain-containing protein [Thermoanaerobaculia bacterium]
MKKRLLDWIVCPACGERPELRVFNKERIEIPPEAQALPESDSLREEILEAALTCRCGLVYPVIEGIPRMLRNARQEYPEFFARHDDLAGLDRAGDLVAAAPKSAAPVADPRSAQSFRLQWTVYQEGDHTWFKDDAGLRKREFLYNLDTTAEELSGKLMLDAGCGNGELTRAIAEYGVEIVAMDFSRSVERARQRLFEKGFPVSHRVHYLQGNVLELPLRRRSFDLVHSSGVLHHTPSTERAFRSVAQAPKPGGKLYVQLYRRRPTWIHAINVTLRAATTRLPMGLLYRLCYAATPVHSALSRLMHFLRGEPAPPQATARERAVQMFDNYSPKFQYRHAVPEIMELFRGAGYENLKDVTLENEARHMLAVLGTRTAEATARVPEEEAKPAASAGSPLPASI